MDPLKIVGQNPAAKETDPVCGMSVDPATARGKVEHGGKTYYFCCPGCATRFQAEPEKYLHNKPGAQVVSISAAAPKHTPVAQTVKDPVCGMRVDPAHAAGQIEHAGTTYSFCSQHCVDKFRANPSAYLDPGAAAETPASTQTAPGTAWICPIGPEIS